MNIFKIAILSGASFGLFGFMSKTKDGMLFFAKSKNKEDNGEVKETGVTVIKKWEMPKELTEISGLSYMDEQRFACVQDELGKIFIYNITSSRVEKEIPFGAAGDYEGLAVVGETIWVLRSDGNLFEVSNIQTAKPAVTEYGTPLTMKQDSEGLCYDKKNNRLLIAIKGVEPGTDDYKGIYAFDLASKKMDQQPVFKINLFDKVFETNGKKKRGSLNPSGISIHPVNGDMYITDGRDPKLLVTDAGGAIKKLYSLNIKEFAQPEGITFNSAGDLFISNEGTKQPGNILQVKIDL